MEFREPEKAAVETSPRVGILKEVKAAQLLARVKRVFNAFRTRANSGELAHAEKAAVTENKPGGGGGNVLVVEDEGEAGSSEDLSEERESVSFSEHRRELAGREVKIRLLESEVATLLAREQELL